MGYLPSWAKEKKPAIFTAQPDIQLVMQNVKGLNVFRCCQRFYAIPMRSGEFSQARAEAGDYDQCIEGSSLRIVLHYLDDLPDTGNSL